MADIRISALPLEPTPSGNDYLAVDLASTRRTTVTAAVLAGRPTASQAEAEAGTDPTKAMTPLTTKQAITFYGPTLFQPLNTKLTNFAGTSQAAGDLIFAAGVNTFSTLTAGSNGQFLTITGGNPTWVNAAPGGDVTGPASSVTGSIPTFNGATGKVIQAGNPTMADFLTASRGPMSTISNNGTDAVNDIDFSAGAAFSSDASSWPMIGAALTKQLDAAWAVGNNAGGRMSAAAIANTTYHCYQIRRPDTGVVDYGFDVSATAPTLPTNYTQYRRIGSILRESGVIVQFKQAGDIFKRAGASATSSTSTIATALMTFAVPIGIVVQPIMLVSSSVVAATSTSTTMGDAAFGGTATMNVQANFATSAQVDPIPPIFSTNTSGQIYVGNTVVGAITSFSITCNGWVDTRGR